MAIKFRDFFSELKVGMFSVYPSISEVLHTLRMNLIPIFDLVLEDGQKKTIAIVSESVAISAVRFENISKKIEDVASIEKNENHQIIFMAINPAINAWMKEGNFIACSRTLASLFLMISENENVRLSTLIDDVIWQLKEEYKNTFNNFEKKSILTALERLEGVGKNDIEFKENSNSIAKSPSSIVSDINKESSRHNYANYLSEPPPSLPSNQELKNINNNNSSVKKSTNDEFPQAMKLADASKSNADTVKSPKSIDINGLIGIRVQKEIKGFLVKDALLWKECLVETKNELESAELLYRVARTKFLIKLNSEHMSSEAKHYSFENEMKFGYCSTQSEARILAFKS